MAERTTYDDETVEAMARAHYERQASGPGISVQMKWATWEEACRCDGFLEEKLACMRAGLSALPQPRPTADDAEWVLAPRPPTRVMLLAAGHVSPNSPHFARKVYDAMLDAAPTPPSASEREREA